MKKKSYNNISNDIEAGKTTKQNTKKLTNSNNSNNNNNNNKINNLYSDNTVRVYGLFRCQ